MPPLPEMFDMLMIGLYYLVHAVAVGGCILNFAIALFVLVGYTLMGDDPDPTFKKK